MILKEVDFEYKVLRCHCIISTKSIQNTIQITFTNLDQNYDQGLAYFLPFEYDEIMTNADIIKTIQNMDDFQQIYNLAAKAFNFT
jgi:hypothetical protein